MCAKWTKTLLRDAPFDISRGGGGGGRKNMKKIVATKVRIFFLLKMWGEKKNCCLNWGNMLTRKKNQMVTYIMGKAYEKKIYFISSIKQKKLSDGTKVCFLAEVKSNKKSSPPPPQISDGASLKLYVKKFSSHSGLVERCLYFLLEHFSERILL